ncbi:MAG: SWIM zinc finger family protein [Pseudomonadota bacterium]
MAVTLDKIETLAPDQASLAAAARIKASAWPLLAQNSAGALAWGECQGSGSTPYRVALALDDLGYKCTCPSRKFPCKHSLGLMLQFVRAPQSFGEAVIPDWVADWAGRRRAKPVGGKPEGAAGPRASLAVAEAEAAPAESDEKARQRALEQRERLRAEREDSIRRGLDELDLWISDRLARGIAHFTTDAAQQCRIAAQRLVDAKAPALAARLDGLPSELLALPERLRADAAIEALGSFHLLAQAYRRQEKLPEDLRQDVRRLIGWTQERQALLDDSSARRVSADWTVIATHAEIQPDRLKRIETWLAAAQGDDALYAVLIDFVPVATGSGGSPYLPGESFTAELVYYPSAAPLRALIATRGGAAADIRLPAKRLAAALADYDELRARQPWLDQWPMTLAGTEVIRCKDAGLWLADGDDGIKLAPRQEGEALVLGDIPHEAITGLWDGRFFTAVLADTALGRWIRA